MISTNRASGPFKTLFPKLPHFATSILFDSLGKSHHESYTQYTISTAL